MGRNCDPPTIKLEPASKAPPADLATMLQELGDGEAGFGGTPFGRGELGLSEYLDALLRNENPDCIPDGRVPETVFWIIAEGTTVGMLRMRHYLNEALQVKGGHIGYFIRPSVRSRGFATEALRLGLQVLATRGERRALLTTDPDNTASIRVIRANGGTFTGQVPDPAGAGVINQYWIDLV